MKYNKVLFCNLLCFISFMFYILYHIVPKLAKLNFRTLLEPALDAKSKAPIGGLHLALHGNYLNYLKLNLSIFT
jgi:hypothetical protein